MVDKKLQWKFPAQNTLIFRIEAAFVAILTLLIFIGTLFYYDKQILFPILFALLFLILYVISTYVIRLIRQAEEHYLAHGTHLEITRKTKNTTSKIKVPWNNVVMHKLDRFFLGGYVLTKNKKKHPLFFNTKKEVENFDQFAKQKIKPNIP